MTTAIPTIPYASPVVGTCPLCNDRPIAKKTIYGHGVCKKCYYKFLNRRQLAYVVDSLIVIVPAMVIILPISYGMIHAGVNPLVQQAVNLVAGLLLGCLFAMRDGFGGYSPGKRLMGVQVQSQTDRQPIGFDQSFKRNAVLLVGSIPIVGGLCSLIVVIIIIVKMGKGYRLGDKFALTRVIWKKYEHLPIFGGDALVCTGCGYNLQGNVSGVCPECGKPVLVDVQTQVIPSV